jgi:hypothetical protein
MDREQLRLAGLQPQRPSLREIQLESSDFPPDLHPHEMIHAKRGAHSRLGDSEHWDHYFKASGEAHHHSHGAHEMSALIKSKEVSGEPGHHENAYHAHEHAMKAHHHAGEMALRAGAPWMHAVHRGHAAGHEQMMVKHGKKFKK